jgi:predicted DNA-binding transcriptional regulator AlpA
MSESANPFEPFFDEIRRIVREEIAAATNGNGHADRLLTPDEAAEVLGMSVKWVYRNAHKLPFSRKLGRKTLRFSYLGIQKYLATRINFQTR